MLRQCLAVAVVGFCMQGFGHRAEAQEFGAELAPVLEPAEAAELLAAPEQTSACARSPEQVQQLAYERTSRLEVVNQGGLLGGGVCWWHSRLQRSALYLANFRPDLPKATHAQGVTIINTLANMSRVVTIPGYANFSEFSRDYPREIIRRLESWQRVDGFLNFRWIDGLKGHWRLPAATLQYIMGRIHQLVTVEHRVLFEKLHFNKLDSHAYLVIGSRQTTDGYEIDVIDSNHPTETLTVPYHRGQTSLYLADAHWPFVPYLDFEKDMARIHGALRAGCHPHP